MHIASSILTVQGRPEKKKDSRKVVGCGSLISVGWSPVVRAENNKSVVKDPSPLQRRCDVADSIVHHLGHGTHVHALCGDVGKFAEHVHVFLRSLQRPVHVLVWQVKEHGLG